MNKFFALTLGLGIPLACGGTSDSSDPKGGSAGKTEHESAGAGVGAAGHAGGGGSAGRGGAGAGRGGTGASGAGAGGAGGGGRGGAGANGGAGQGGSSAGRGGRGGDAGGGDVGASGEAGDGAVCGGRGGKACELGQYCKYDNGMCGSADETGTCTTQPAGIACVQGYACGCDGKVYMNLCIAHSSGVDVWTGNQCVPGNGTTGDACLTDDDCSGGLKCCSSPIQVISCTTPMGSGCPLTP